jgi:hypothetical protein
VPDDSGVLSKVVDDAIGVNCVGANCVANDVLQSSCSSGDCGGGGVADEPRSLGAGGSVRIVGACGTGTGGGNSNTGARTRIGEMPSIELPPANGELADHGDPPASGECTAPAAAAAAAAAGALMEFADHGDDWVRSRSSNCSSSVASPARATT